MRFILAIALLLCASASAAAQVPGNCGLQLGGPVIFCETFDTPNPGIPGRTGALHPDVWGVSRMTGLTNPGQGLYNAWAPTTLQTCTGSVTGVTPPNDVIICNGQLREASNDNADGGFEGGVVTSLAMYPKQPFDFAGRTGTVSFDVSNDSHGGHSAWPEFWITDLPIPAPFAWNGGNTQPVPQHGFGIRFYGVNNPAIEGCSGQNASYPIGQRMWNPGAVVVVRNYIVDDSDFGGSIAVTKLDCVTSPPDGSGLLNHVEVRVSQNQIDVYATDAGTTSPLKHIAVIQNVNLTLSRGLIWIEDVHYNADKGVPPSQREHTFVWDNVAFDGPFTYRDFSYDALDNDELHTDPTAVNLGKPSNPPGNATFNVLNMPANPQAQVVRVLFNINTGNTQSNMTVTVNGHVHPVPWPFPDTDAGNRTMAVTIPITDLVAGTNVVIFNTDPGMIVFNVNIVLTNVPGGVPVLPGSNNSYPTGGPVAIDGMCGSANGVPVSVAPTANLCTAGMASTVSGSGPWSWSCAGSNGGATAMCSAPLLPPPGRVAVTGTSGFHNNSAAMATLPAVVGKTTYICGFAITSTGSSVSQVVSPTVAGVIGGTLNYTYVAVAGVRTANRDLLQPFAPCLPAAGVGTSIVVTLPALGTGNTNATVNAWGYQQ